jgi:hypothetical protein
MPTALLSEEKNVANYGDVALGLKADWSRNKYQKPEQTLFAIGHEGGEADVYLTDDPDAEHQFRWVNPLDKEEVTGLLMRKYQFVTKDKWTKRVDYMWEWNAEGKIYYGGQILMARPKSLWQDDENTRAGMHRESRRDTRDPELDRAPDGLIATDAEGKPKRKKGI